MNLPIQLIPKNLFLCLFLLMGTVAAFGTHNRAGEISVEQISTNTIRATITTYTKASSVQADRDSLTLCWGDGTCQTLLRLNGPIIDGFPNGDPLPNDSKVNIYSGIHTYPGLGTYKLSMTDPNRNGGILNVNPPFSDMIEFHLETTFTFFNPQFEGFNSTPILLQPPIDIGCVNEQFIHNPNAFDQDGDSLAYRLIVPLRGLAEGTGERVEVPNYRYPEQIQPGADNDHYLDPVTGEFVWTSPQRAGEYNIAIEIIEYRRGIPIDSMIRDMQILIINDCQNQPPEIDVPREICVVAGETVEFDVVVTDPDMPLQNVELTALGGPFETSISPAVLEVAPGYQPQALIGKFIWQTTCEHISNQTYSVVFRATDDKEVIESNGDRSFLSTLETVLIKVVGPPPEEVSAEVESEEVTISWAKPYTCEDAANDYFRGFTVWRKVGSNLFPPDSCSPGLGGRGYERLNIAFTTEMEDGRYVFKDPDIERGRTYCYRILAHFAQLSAGNNPYNLVESLPSEEICIQLGRDIPIITKVSVLSTDPLDGSIQIDWTKPGAAELDTIQNPPPYRYQLLRATGLNGQDFQAVPGADFVSNTYAGANDTTFTDTGLNTQADAYSYKIVFFTNNNANPLGDSAPAASVFASANPTDEAINLSWEENIPWNNYEYIIFRQNNSGTFDSIGVSRERSFIDTGLENGTTYCYQILALGSYGIDGIISPLLNYSQEVCTEPFDNVPSCAPELAVSNICDESSEVPVQEEDIFNMLTWNNPNETCPEVEDVVSYKVYYASREGAALELLDNIDNAQNTEYDHRSSEVGIAGCYAVTAIDQNGNESPQSNVVCVENCPEYSLPNTFTPNGDGTNELFRPFPYRFIERVEFKVFNRWGGLVFETTDPDINWNGTNLNGEILSDGVYYYVCKVFSFSLTGVDESPLLLKGPIHLIKG